jgi:hypothetical protein
MLQVDPTLKESYYSLEDVAGTLVSQCYRETLLRPNESVPFSWLRHWLTMRDSLSSTRPFALVPGQTTLPALVNHMHTLYAAVKALVEEALAAPAPPSGLPATPHRQPASLRRRCASAGSHGSSTSSTLSFVDAHGSIGGDSDGAAGRRQRAGSHGSGCNGGEGGGCDGCGPCAKVGSDHSGLGGVGCTAGCGCSEGPEEGGPSGCYRCAWDVKRTCGGVQCCGRGCACQRGA